MFSNDRNQLRTFFLTAWQKKQQNAALEPLETLVVQVIEQHPEYHALLANDNAIDKDFSVDGGESNPFLHMSMHITIAEQLSIGQPSEISDLYQKLSQKTGNSHDAEHQIMECLGLMLWQAQRNNQPPDNKIYIDCLKKLVGQ